MFKKACWYFCSALAISSISLRSLALTDNNDASNKTAVKPITADKPLVEYYNSKEMDKLKLPFSESVRVGNIVFLSGQIGMKDDGSGLVAGGIQAETRQTLKNMQRTLKAQNLDLSDIVKCTVFLADMKEWSKMNEVYIVMFNGHRPARSAFGVNGVALGGSLEMECMAVITKP